MKYYCKDGELFPVAYISDRKRKTFLARTILSNDDYGDD